MPKLRIGFIGTGKVPERASAMGYAMAYRHANGYIQLPDDCEIVACADIVEANGRAFADKYGFDKVYLEYHRMLAEEDLSHADLAGADLRGARYNRYTSWSVDFDPKAAGAILELSS